MHIKDFYGKRSDGLLFFVFLTVMATLDKIFTSMKKRVDIVALIFMIIMLCWALLGIWWLYVDIWGYPNWSTSFLNWNNVDPEKTDKSFIDWLVYCMFGPGVTLVFYVAYYRKQV